MLVFQISLKIGKTFRWFLRRRKSVPGFRTSIGECIFQENALDMTANCFFKERMLPCCEVMDSCEYLTWRITNVFVLFLSFNISETQHITSKVFIDEPK